MSRALVTKYIPSSDHKPARIRLTCADVPTKYVSYNSCLPADGSYEDKARWLAEEFFTQRRWCANTHEVSVPYELPNGDLCFVVV